MSDLDTLQQYQLGKSELRNSSARQTPITSFSETFQRGLATTTNSVANATAAAGYAIPGSTVVSAAISGVGTVKSSTGGLSSVATSGTGLVASSGTVGSTASTATSSVTSSVATNAANGDASSQLMLATQQMQEMNQNFNLQYLQLQESMQQDSRQFTAMSNVIKTKSDTAKNSLSNIK